MFDFDYTGGRDQLLRLYDKGTRRQWIGSDRLDWSQEVDLTNPVGMPDEIIPIFGTEWWDKMSDERKGEVRRHIEAWRFSQFMHGEQGALICTAKIVQTVPDIDSKFYAATQVIDEARHVEVYSRYLHEKVQLVYPLNPHLKALLDDVISDSRWDMTYLGMQVLIEGLALAAFGIIRNNATDPLAKALNAYVMQDEARHVMFGRLALRDYYPQLSQAERDEREDFCIEACYLMRDRFLGEEVWERLELPPEIATYVDNSETLREFRNFLFMRIVPILRDIGLWGPKLRTAFEDDGRDRLRRHRHRRRDGRATRRRPQDLRRGPRRPHGPRARRWPSRPETGPGRRDGSAAFHGPLEPVLNLLGRLVGVEIVAPGGDLAVARRRRSRWRRSCRWGCPALPSPAWKVAVPVHSKTAQSSPPRMRSTRWFQSGKMASVSRATLCRSVVHGVTGSQKRPPGAKRAAKSSGPSMDSNVAAPSASQSLVPVLIDPPFPGCAAQTLRLEGDHRVVEREDHLRAATNWCASATSLTAVPQAVNPTAWRAKLIGPSVTLTSTTPSPPASRAERCMRSMADSRAEYMASV